MHLIVVISEILSAAAVTTTQWHLQTTATSGVKVLPMMVVVMVLMWEDATQVTRLIILVLANI